MLLVQHVNDKKELQIVTHHRYKPIASVQFSEDTELDRFANLSPTGQFTVFTAEKIESLMVDPSRLELICHCTLYRCASRPHPALGEYVLIVPN